MKKLALIVLLLISLTGVAQNKFIEVEVTDTISLKPLNFQVNVYVNDEFVVAFDEDNEDEVYDALAEKEKEKNKIQQVRSMLLSKKYVVRPLDESKLSPFEMKVYGREKREGLTVNVIGLVEVQKLNELLDSNKDIKTIVTVLKYANEQVAEEQLIKKLVDKAKTRASVIGANAQLKLGKIIEVSEGRPSAEIGIHDMYLQIAKMGVTGFVGGDYTGTLSKTFVIKFAAE